MSGIREQLEAGLQCPKCGATNRPGATYISLEPGAQASCLVCAYTGPLTAFEPSPAEPRSGNAGSTTREP